MWIIGPVKQIVDVQNYDFTLSASLNICLECSKWKKKINWKFWKVFSAHFIMKCLATYIDCLLIIVLPLANTICLFPNLHIGNIVYDLSILAHISLAI